MLNQIILKSVGLMPKSLVYTFAKKYIAGEFLSDATKVTKDFEKMGGRTTIDVLGEFVTSKERANHEKEMSKEVLKAILDNNLPTYLSIKPTSLGLGIDFDFGFKNISEVIKIANENNIFVRLDMENSPYTTMTLDIYKKLRSEGLDNCGVVLQAYMKRSFEDLKDLVKLNPSIRLCKGIYTEDSSIAYKEKEEIRNNYKKLLQFMFDNGVKTHIATHDDPLIDYADDLISKNSIEKDRYEFQMLLGVREYRRNEILSKGHNMRIYVPFGEDWYGYSIRRLNENPQMAGHIFKSLFSRK
ncbi:MAG: proline dehydrogenase family protein [Candidatus Kapabacteria bacterium]|nr:proline dehydrogenase family protein [Candidatus Kapabacteria bacterium]